MIALLPWWAGVGMAVVGYGVLHTLAAPGAIPMAQPNQFSQHAGKLLGKMLAYSWQFIMPVICLPERYCWPGVAGGAALWWPRPRRTRRPAYWTVVMHAIRAACREMVSPAGLRGRRNQRQRPRRRHGPCVNQGGETVLKMCTCSKRLGSVYSNRLKVDVTKNSRDNDL